MSRWEQQDIIGLRSGRLTVIAPTEQTRRGCALWLCRCDCGAEVQVPAGRLTSGHTTSCGCARGKALSARARDITDQRFGRLTALAPAESVGSRTTWRCICDCGKEHIVQTHNLRSGHVRSCGCSNFIQDKGGNRKHRGHPEGLDRLHYIDGTCVEMLRKNPVRGNNSSGVTGVDWRKDKRRWRASICFKGTRYNLGEYEKFDDAVRARREAEDRLHGTFLANYDTQNAVTAP